MHELKSRTVDPSILITHVRTLQLSRYELSRYGTFGRYKSDGSWLASGGVKTGLNVLVMVRNP